MKRQKKSLFYSLTIEKIFTKNSKLFDAECTLILQRFNIYFFLQIKPFTPDLFYRIWSDSISRVVIYVAPQTSFDTVLNPCFLCESMTKIKKKRHERGKKKPSRHNSLEHLYFFSCYSLVTPPVVNPSMIICGVTDSANAQTNPNRKMKRSDHLCLSDDKMIQVNENTNQPTTKENKKGILSERTIQFNGQTLEKSGGGFPINYSKNSRTNSVTISYAIC